MSPRDWQNGASALAWAALGIWYWRRWRNAPRTAEPSPSEPPDWRRDAIWALAATIPFWFFANIGLLSDDWVHASRPFTGDAAAATFLNGGGDGFYRPIGNVLLSVEASLWGASPFGWHAVSILLHAVVVFLLCRIGGLCGFGNGARWAALCFAVQGARCEPVLWPAAQYDLLMTLFLLAGVWAVLAEKPLWVTLVLVPLAALSKEPGFLLAPVLTMAGWPHWKRFLPHWGLAGLLFLGRLALFDGGIGGYPVDSPLRLVKVAEVLLWRLPGVMLSAWNLVAPKSTLELVVMAVGPLAVAITFVLQNPARPASRTWPFLAAAAMSLALVVRLSPIEPSLEKSRMLYLPAALLAIVLGGLRFGNGKLVWGLWTGLAAASLFSNGLVEARVAAKAAALCRASGKGEATVDARTLPRTVDGVYYFANGFPECVQLSR